jgi:HAE1 family hydrophobic/amphiphilic exporter-1
LFVDFFIRRPVFATVCALLIILGGAISIPTLPIAQFPNLAPPQVVVSSAYIGANAQTVESAVTIPLEQAINGVQGMKYITSSSGNDGTSQITVTFDVSRDVDLASVDVQNRVNQALGRLPDTVKNTGVIITKQLGGFVFGAGVYTENGQYDSLFLSNYLDIYVKDAIKRVPGVGDAIIFGERKYAMRLWLDPARMGERGLTATTVLTALNEQNVQVAAGEVGQPPSRDGQAYEISVRAIGRLTEPSEFDNIVLKSGTDGTLVRLKDVGRAELGAESYDSLLRFDGHDAVGLAVTQLPGANALDVDKAAKAELELLSKNFPPGMKYAVAFDSTTVVGESIKDVLITLIQAVCLVIIVIYLFLQDWRSTFIPAITIPVSLVGTFIFVKLFGFSINTLTLFGITLATGLVVDDAIVVIENITRFLEQGMSPLEAALVGSREIGFTVVSMSVAGAGGGIRSGGLVSRDDGNLVPAIRADDCVLCVDFCFQCFDADAGVVGDFSGTSPGAGTRAFFPRVQSRGRGGNERVSSYGAACDWMAVRSPSVVCVRAGRDVLGVPTRSARVYSGRRPGLHHVHHPGAAGCLPDLHA